MFKGTVVIICDDHIYQSALQKCMASIRYFHPEFKIVHYNTEKINRIKKELTCPDIRFIAPTICKEVWDNENPDILIKMGADCLVLGRMDEVLTWDYDIAAPRNDSDYSTVFWRDESINRPDSLRGIIDNHEYVNCDFVCIKNKKFIDSWEELTLNYWWQKKMAIKWKNHWGDDQNSLNEIFYLGNFNSSVLDPLGSKRCYGASANWSGEENFSNKLTPSMKTNGANCWPSWMNFYEKNGKTIVPNNGIGMDREAVVIHVGGGTWGGNDGKMNFDLFNPEYRKYLKKITGFDV